MNKDYPDPADEFLESEFADMRGRPLPDGPSEELVTGTLTALNAAADRKPNIFMRITNMKPITRIAASALLAAGLIALAITMLRSPSVTCAEVVEKVRSAHSMSFVMTVTPAKNKPIEIKMLMTDQGQLLAEGSDGSRTVSDVKAGHILVVQPQAKTAIVMDLKNFPDKQRPDGFIDGFKKLEGKSAKDLGATEIDGRRARKFIATQDRQDFTVWADPQTGDPIRIDITVTTMDQKTTVSCTDFLMNPTVPEDAFKLDIPAGYSVQRLNLDFPDISNGEQNLIEVLGRFAQETGGKFPQNLDDPTGKYVKLMQARGTTRPTDADMQWLIRFQMVQHFLGALPKDGWKYLGDGKTLKDKDAMIFWYKADKGYRAIYGDLTAKDLPAAPR
jgi:outer membrane lipoprotein-sorting protein